MRVCVVLIVSEWCVVDVFVIVIGVVIWYMNLGEVCMLLC